MSKKVALLLIAGIVLAIALISLVSITFWGPEPERSYIYVTTEGFGEDNDVTDKLLVIDPGDTMAEIFSMKYKEYYEFFEKPLVRANEFVDFFGKQKGNGAKIRVYINNVLTLDIEQAYLGDGADVRIEYQK